LCARNSVSNSATSRSFMATTARVVTICSRRASISASKASMRRRSSSIHSYGPAHLTCDT
jgi:hypothetical protein